jgi:hypothetical protein
MADANTMASDALDAPLGRGTAVEVHSGFSGRWAPGFSIDEVGSGGYGLRRSHDQAVLPAVFAPEIMRPER